MTASPEDTKKRSSKYKRTGRFLQLPENSLSQPPPSVRRRSNSFPSLQLIPPLPPPPPLLLHTPRRQCSRIDMSQRSAVARIKLEKVIASPAAEPHHHHHQTAGKSSHNRFNNLFSSSAPQTTSSNGYQLLHPARALSVSSLQSVPGAASKGSNTSLRNSSKPHGGGKFVVVQSSVPEELRRLKGAYAALLAENAQLRTALDAEKGFSAKLGCFLQQYHESEGRFNPDPGNLESVYYRGLEDEDGCSLVSSGMVKGPIESLGGVEEDCLGDEGEVNGEMEMIKRRKAMIARSFESQRA